MCIAIYVVEDDVASYTIKTIDDPRTLNKTLYIRPPKNILSQREVVSIWEKLIGKELDKITISKEDFLASMKGDLFAQLKFSKLYPQTIIGELCHTNKVKVANCL